MGLLLSKTTSSPSPPTQPNGTSPPPTPPPDTTTAPPVVTTPSPPQQPPPVAATPSPSPPPPPVGNVLPLLANGQYAVGCADIMLSEPSAASSSSAGGVGLFARLFYPAAPSVVLPTDPSTSSASTPAAFMRWRPDTEYMVGLANYQGMSVGKMNFFLDWVVGDKK
ncbi:hypothetical protein niasHS_008124 [Heterodera schachtii]|uniref:Uncharacterized protein n=1 Tax=Heterodera schachtii TaxID=97005 RepID=A0ABD2J1I8_HETSC